MRLENARYLLSVHDPAKLPAATVPEVAFIGRSNAGKSSALNTLCGRRRLAFVSKTPGRTQLINFFTVDGDVCLVDLPGYGYAGVPHEVRRHWDHLVGDYVFHRQALAGVVVVMDVRHPLAAADRRLLEWLLPSGRPVHVLLSKSDKLSTLAGNRTLAAVRRDLTQIYPGASVQLFSSLKRTGREEAFSCIETWVREQKQKAPAAGDSAGAKLP